MSEMTIDRGFALECAQALIRAPSENPPGDERDVARVAAAFAQRAGCEVQTIETAPNRLNVIATVDSGRPGRTLLWNGHIDVVPAMDHASWAHPPYDAVVENGVLHGRGSADMKGPCAAAITAAKALCDAGLPKSGRFVLHLVADEEVLGPHGTTALYQRGLSSADAAIVGEPTDLTIAIAERGMVWVRVRTSGTSAHGSTPHLGISAIEEMARAVTVLRAMTWDMPHPLLGPPTLNVGTIHGGDKINIVPSWCEAEIDRRTIPGETFESILAEMDAALQAAGVTAELSIFHSAQPCEIDPGEEIVRLASEAHRAVRKRDAPIGVMTATTDAHVLVGTAKIPTIIFGPGSLDQAHTTTEHMLIEDLNDAAAIYAGIAAAYLR